MTARYHVGASVLTGEIWDERMPKNNLAAKWLNQTAGLTRFPIDELLEDSLYYPACGDDWAPVHRLAPCIQSFIYADYRFGYGDIEPALNATLPEFRVVSCKRVEPGQVFPGGWPELPHQVLARADSIGVKEPSCLWAILDRDAGADQELISLLYLCAEAISAYRALYARRRTAPTALAIIQPGSAYGMGWTYLDARDGAFAQLVLDGEAPAPRHLLYGGYNAPYPAPCWPEYSREIAHWDYLDGGEVRVWEKG